MTQRQIKLVENYIKRTVKRFLVEEKTLIYHGVCRIRGNSNEMICAFLKSNDANNLISMMKKGKPPVKNETYSVKLFKYTEFGWEDAE